MGVGREFVGWKSGVGWEVLGIMKWCWQVRGVAVELLDWGAAEASPLEIGEGTPLDLEGGWVGVGRDLVGCVVASSCGRGLGVDVWILVGYR